jgi:1,4-alpha-glucan branching enzyme
VNGDFKGWCGIRAAITDLNNDGIWEVAVMGLSDSIEFKYSNDEWTGQESLQPGSS